MIRATVWRCLTARSAACGCAVLFASLTGEGAARAEPITVDRAVVRFVASETGGVASPRYIFERQLAFEARLEALSDVRFEGGDRPFLERHLRSALERHVAETLLESLDIDPVPTKEELAERVAAARLSIAHAVGGLQRLGEAAHAEGLGAGEVSRLLLRRARASLYLDRMVAPMLEPSDAELRSVHLTLRTPFSGKPYEEIEAPLRRWYTSHRLAAALASFFEGARGRLKLVLL